MRKSIIFTAVAALTATTFAACVTPAEARHRSKHHPREWRGADGKMHCRRNNGTIGVVVGGVAGALVGRSIDTRGDRTVGTVVGAGAGAMAGRAIVRKRSCR
ncbi:MAG: glycine zipper 2TM domain-containing protein [Novosphingobium sp.]|mgnify:FL=1